MDTYDLEQEFERLTRTITDKIKDMVLHGEISPEAGVKVIDILDDCVHSAANPCPHGHAPGCGWSPSMGYHC